MKKLIRYSPVKSGAVGGLGTWGEVMASSLTFIRDSIHCFYPPSVLCVKFASWQEYGPNGYWKLLT